ncbi:hypothetical protein IP88_11615 [alpha proteobacterium AAP81b]|nr:hypothetical protein IP88_11615 [alpha proteobacterium AAP81b]
MDALMRFPTAVRRDPAVDAWFDAPLEPLRLIVRPWFAAMRACGDDVRELIHDHVPTACLGDAAFGYVAAFRTHASVGFFQGAALPDPAGLLEGSGKRMRHVKLRWGQDIDTDALMALIAAACRDMRVRLADGGEAQP